MLNNKHSKSQYLSHSKLQPQTAETLTQISSSNSPDYSLYESYEISEQQLVQQTLTHCNLEWMLERLERIKVEAVKVSKERKIEEEKEGNGIVKIVKGFEEVSEEVKSMLTKVRKCRESLNSKIFGLFKNRASINNSNLIRKANIFKYKEALLIIRNLNNNIKHNLLQEEDFDMQTNRLQTSGLILVPSLIEKGLLNYIYKHVYEFKQIVTIRRIGNLNLIVEEFLGPNKSEEKEELYFKFKQYIVLKTYIDTRTIDKEINNGEEAIDVLCQANISEYLDRRISFIEEKEMIKVKSLVQCNKKICIFFRHQVQKKVFSVIKSTMNFIRKINDQSVYVEKYVIQKTLNKNKKMSNLKSFVLPAEIAEFFTSENFSKMITHEEISDAIHQIEKVEMLFSCFSSDLSLNLTASDLKEVVIYKSIFVLILPMIQLNGGILKILSKDEQERKYHMLRSIYRNIEGYQNLFGAHLKSRISISMEIMHEYVQRIECGNVGTPLKSNECLPEIKFHIDKKERKMLKQMSIGEFYISYNENYAETYIYLVNKLTNTPKRKVAQGVAKNIHELGGDKETLKKLEQLIMIWVELVSDQVCEHQLQEHHPANILKNIQFLQNKIIDNLEEKHSIENQMNEIVLVLASEKSGKKGRSVHEGKKEQIYKNLVKLNLKTRSYCKLMEMSKMIDVYEEMRGIHEDMYDQVYENLSFV